MSTPPLRGLRGTRRVWSSDEEDNVPPRKPAANGVVAASSAVPRIALSARVTQGTPLGSSATVTPPRTASPAPGGVPVRRAAMKAVGLGSADPLTSARTPPDSRVTSPGSRTPRIGLDAGNVMQLREDLRKEIRAELSTTTSAMQEQAREWRSLLSEARGAIRGGKIVVQSGSPPRGSTSGSPSCGSDRQSRFGDDLGGVGAGISAAKVIDAQSILVRKLEDALTTRAGFIGGLFHTWRCEIVLQRAERNFGAFKDEVNRKNLVQRNRIQLAANEFLMGNLKGLMSTVFKDWNSTTMAERHRFQFEDAERRHQEDIARQNGQIQAGMDQLLAHHQRAKQDLYVVLAKWEKGSTKGLMEVSMQSWREFVKSSKASQLASHRIQLAANEWLMGNRKGLLSSVFKDWSAAAMAERHRSIHDEKDQRHAEEIARLNAQIQNGMDSLLARHARAKQDLYVVLAKWEKGSIKGLMEASMQAWREAVKSAKAQEKKAVVFKEMMRQWFEGEMKGLMHSIYERWRAVADKSSAIRREQQKLDDFLSGHQDQMEEEAQRRQQEEEAKRQRARESVQLMIKKWEMGNDAGLQSEVFTAWHRFAAKWAAIHRNKGTAQMAMAKFLEGDKRGLLQTCLMHWNHEYKQAKQDGWHKEALGAQQRELDAFLTSELHRYQAALDAEARKRARSHATTERALFAWEAGNKKGALIQTLRAWKTYAATSAKDGRGKNSVHLAMLKFLEGDKRALKQSCFQNWQACTRSEKQAREKEGQLEMQQRQWAGFLDEKQTEWEQSAEAARRESAHNSAQLMVKKWLLGETKGLLSSVLSDWSAYVQESANRERQHEAAKASILRWLEGDRKALTQMCWTHWVHFKEREDIHRRCNQTEVDMREQDRLHQIKLVEDKEKKLAVMMNMGLKSDKALEMKYFFVWSDIFQKDRQSRLHRMEHSEVLSKLGAYLQNKFAMSCAKDLTVSCLKEWAAEAHASKYEYYIGSLNELKTIVEQLQGERLALAEQLTVVYQQLDAVTDTLQKELKTKEELAKELRDANEQVFNSNFGGNVRIDIASIVGGAQTPRSERGSEIGRDVKSWRRTPSESGRSDQGDGWRARRARTPPSRQGEESAKESALSPDSAILDSASSCHWGQAIGRMHDRGILHDVGTRL